MAIVTIKTSMDNADSGPKPTPSYHGEHCLYTGEYAGYECFCDDCDHRLICFPDWFPGAIWDETTHRFI